MFDRLTELIGDDGEPECHADSPLFIAGFPGATADGAPPYRVLPTVCLLAAWLSFDVLAAAGLFGLLSVLVR